MELNIIELYKLLISEPEGFKVALKNIYGGEILRLRAAVEAAIAFVEDEDGKDANRNRFIESELEDLSGSLKQVADFSSSFRYVALGDEEESLLTCETIRIRLMDLRHWTLEAKNNFHDNLKRDSEHFGSRTQDIEAFEKQKIEVTDTLHKVDAGLEAIDENLKH